jgi:hypothetical protein
MDEPYPNLTPQPPHRLALATLAVAVPVIVGASVTLALWHAKEGSVQAISTTYATPSAAPAPKKQVLLSDGVNLIPWPLTSAPIHLAVGQRLEIVLARLPNESVQTLEPSALIAMPAPACQLVSVCGLANVNRWTFLARLPGSFTVVIDYGLRCRASVCLNAPTSLTVLVAPR